MWRAILLLALIAYARRNVEQTAKPTRADIDLLIMNLRERRILEREARLDLEIARQEEAKAKARVGLIEHALAEEECNISELEHDLLKLVRSYTGAEIDEGETWLMLTCK